MPATATSMISRRAFLTNGGKLSIIGFSALAVGVGGLAGRARAAEEPKETKDPDTLNDMLGREHQAVATYQIGADSGLLKQPGLNIALLFQSHHKAHRDSLSDAVKKAGGEPVPAMSTPEYMTKLNANALKSQNDVLEMALKMELDAANAYINVVSVFQNRDFAKLASRIIADDVMHWTALASTLAQPLPANGLTFGA